MRPFMRIVVVAAALLFFASASQAQFVGGFGYRQSAFFQIGTGSFGGFAYAARTYGYAYGPIYGPVPMWYYGYPGVAIVNNPIQVQPPIVIQNIIQAPMAAGRGVRRPVIPPEFEAEPPKAPPPRMAPKAVKKPPAPPPPLLLPGPKAPKALDRADADRLVDAGRKAFADHQHGQALELFRRAAEITPREPSVHYLVSQAQFALGKYREAVTAIAKGMAIRPDWSDARFESRGLYWKKPELFNEHLNSLRRVVEQFPGDAELLFLLGHQLWFDGKREIATPFILKAREIGKEATPAPAFRLDS